MTAFPFRSIAVVIPAALACLLAALPRTAAAQGPGDALTDLDFGELVRMEVSSASKFAQDSRQAPSAVQVIEADEIRRHGWRTLTEVLASLPGVYAVGDRAYDFVGARGFLVPGDYNARFLLLLDGQRLNDNIYEQANFGHEFQLDLALIERIEYIPGPGSSIYGSNAIFGVINVITRQARSLPGASADVRVTGDGWRKARVTASRFGGGDGPDLVVSLSQAAKAGRDQSYPGGAGSLRADGTPSPDGVSHGLDRNEVSRAFASLSWGGFSTSLWAARREVQPSSGLYAANFDDGRLRVVDAAYGLRAAWRQTLDPRWQFDGRLAVQRITYEADYPYFDAGTGSYLNRDLAVGNWASGEARLLYTGFAAHKLIVGAEFGADRRARQENADADLALNVPLRVDTRGHRQGVFIQDEWRFAPAWLLNAGLRRDRFSIGEASTSPRLGLIWEAGERTTFKLLAGRAYRVANAYERDYANDVNYLANADLQPETIRTLEAVGEFRPGNGTTLGASLFDYRITNLIRQVDVGGGLLQYQNQREIAARGLELHLRQRHAGGRSVAASLALNDVRDADGQRFGNSPRWVAKLRGSQPLAGERLLAAIEMHAIGPRQVDWQGTRQALGSQLGVDATLTATRLLPGFELQLRVINLLDRELRHPASDEAPVPFLPAGRREWQLGASHAF